MHRLEQETKRDKWYADKEQIMSGMQTKKKGKSMTAGGYEMIFWQPKFMKVSDDAVVFSKVIAGQDKVSWKAASFYNVHHAHDWGCPANFSTLHYLFLVSSIMLVYFLLLCVENWP